MLFEETQKVLFCSDLFHHNGDVEPLTESDILGPSEAMRAGMDYYAHSPDTRRHLERFAALAPGTLACMHGAAWRGDGRSLLLALAESLAGAPVAAER